MPKTRLTAKYRLALETAQLHCIHAENREHLYVELKKRFSWYPALKQWLDNERYFTKEWGIIPAFSSSDREKAHERGLFTLSELQERAKTSNSGPPDAVIRWGTGSSIDPLFQIQKALPNLYTHPEHGKLPCYRFWNQIPEYLKTQTQIRKTDKKRRPKQPPRALVDTEYENRGGVYLLYDIRECLDKTPQSDAQKQAFRKVREEYNCRQCGKGGIKLTAEGLCGRCKKWRDKERAFENMLNRERNNAILWARELLGKGFVVLDTETTGLYSDAKIVEISIIDGLSGQPFVETLLEPPNFDYFQKHKIQYIPDDATAIHGITDADVEGKPTFQEILPEIERALQGKICAIYNEAYDSPLLKNHGLDTKVYTFDCAMEMYAQFHGDWSDYWESFRWQSLEAAIGQCGLNCSGIAHRAPGDCRTTRELILFLAGQTEGNEIE